MKKSYLCFPVNGNDSMKVRRSFSIVSGICLLLVLLPEVQGRVKNVAGPTESAGLKCRGVMECFPSVADGLEERLDFYASKRLTHYFYSPSDDRYCNRWGWRFLYNDNDRHLVRNIGSLCRKHGLEFVWTINPGGFDEWTAGDYRFLVDKLIMMYYNGIRSFAVCFSHTDGQHMAVRDSLIKDFVSTRKEKVSLYMVNDIPSVSYPSQGQSAVETLMRGYHFDDEFINRVIHSDAMLCRIYESENFARLAVTAVADCSLAPGSYHPDKSLATGIESLDAGVRDSFITFLDHTGGVNESPDVSIFSIEEWTEEKAASLYNEFEKIEKVPEVMRECTESELIGELRPWLKEFGRLGSRGKKVLECMKYYKSGDLKNFWLTSISAIMSVQECEEYGKYPVGSVKLHPFCVKSFSDMMEGFSSMLTGSTHLHNLASTLYSVPNAALDSDFTTFEWTDGHIEFAIPAYADACHLLTGPLPEDSPVLFRQIGTDGSLIAEHVVDTPCATFSLKKGAVKVDVIGTLAVYENIFVSLSDDMDQRIDTAYE